MALLIKTIMSLRSSMIRLNGNGQYSKLTFIINQRIEVKGQHKHGVLDIYTG